LLLSSFFDAKNTTELQFYVIATSPLRHHHLLVFILRSPSHSRMNWRLNPHGVLQFVRRIWDAQWCLNCLLAANCVRFYGSSSCFDKRCSESSYCDKRQSDIEEKTAQFTQWISQRTQRTQEKYATKATNASDATARTRC